MRWAETSGTGAKRSASGRAGSDGLRSSGGHTAVNEALAMGSTGHVCTLPRAHHNCICPCYLEQARSIRRSIRSAAGWKEWTAIAAATDGGLRSAPAGSTHHLWLESSWRSRLPGTEHTARPPWTWRRARRCFAATRRRLARLRGLNICARRFWDCSFISRPAGLRPPPLRSAHPPPTRSRVPQTAFVEEQIKQEVQAAVEATLAVRAHHRRPPTRARSRARSLRPLREFPALRPPRPPRTLPTRSKRRTSTGWCRSGPRMWWRA
jgi:hypothetical protein